ncbi:unnamed protein product [Meloidogyne enterolobii]|uniref:Uncharacterized protein n=1 Tax=Meloidogyne enterolobii TaxID=390850 RepID=A0ACB0ZC87_MELEN
MCCVYSSLFHSTLCSCSDSISSHFNTTLSGLPTTMYVSSLSRTNSFRST